MGERMNLQEQDQAVRLANETIEITEKEKMERQLKENRKKLDYKLVELEQQMFSFAERYGLEDYRTELMIQLHEVAVIMKDQVVLIEGITTATSYLFDTLSFFDEAFNFQNALIGESLKTKYGLFARIKDWIRTRRAIRNIKNRMNLLGKRIANIQGMSQTIVSSISNATLKMREKMEKNKAKMKKTNPNAAKIYEDNESLRMVKDYLARKNGYRESDFDSDGNQNQDSNAGLNPDSLDDIM